MRRLSRAAGLVSVATLISRVLGLLRDAVRAALFGKGWLSDALDVAFKIPNLLRDLFAEGAFSGAFVPTISRAREEHGHEAAFLLLNRVLSTMVVYVGGIVLLIILAADPLVRLIAAPEFLAAPGIHAQAVLLVRVLAPFLLFIALAVAAMGTLNVCGRFFVPALSPALQNVILVAGGILVYRLLRGDPAGAAAAAMPWAVLLLAGGLAQFLIQVPPLLKEGWRPRFVPDLALAAPETRIILRRMLPVVAGLAATHACILINTRLATADEGGASNLYYAFRLVHLPVGLVGVAVGTAVLADASRLAARQDHQGLRRTLGEALLLCVAFAAPACAGLLALGEPLAKLIYGWGREMTGARAAIIGTTIRWYAPAVIFYCSVKVVVPVFYAEGRVRVPVVASLAAVLANLACALALHPWLRWNGLALALGAGQMVNLGVLFVALRAEHGAPGRGLYGRLLRILLSSALCGLAAAGAAALLPDRPDLGARLLRGLAPVAAGVAVYFAAGRMLGCAEVEAVLAAFGRLRRLDRSGRPP